MIKKLNLGCYDKIMEGYINLDQKKYFEGTDVVHNLDQFPYPFKDNTFKEVLMRNVLEHLNNPIKVLREVYRISKNKAIIKIKVPYKEAWMENFDHKMGFDDNAFRALCNDRRWSSQDFNFNLKKIDYIPTSVGRLIPQIRLPFMKSNLRAFISYFIGNIVRDLYVELEVIKEKRY